MGRRIVTSCRRQNVDLYGHEYRVGLERLSMKNVYGGKREVRVYVNEKLLYVFVTPPDGTDILEEPYYQNMVRVKSLNSFNYASIVRFSPEMDESFEMELNVELNERRDDNGMGVALVGIEGRKFPMGERYYVLVGGVSSDFYVGYEDVRSHRCCVYSSIARDKRVVERVDDLMYFACKNVDDLVVSVVDGSNRSIDGCEVYLSRRNVDGSVTMGRFVSSSPVVDDGHVCVDSVVLFTEQLEIHPRLCLSRMGKSQPLIDRYEIALLELNTADGIFDRDSRVVLYLLYDTADMYDVFVDDRTCEGAIFTVRTDCRGGVKCVPKRPMYCTRRNETGMYTFALRFEYASGRAIDVQDGTFEAKFHIRAIA